MTDELDDVFGMVERMAVLGDAVTKMPELESHVAYFETDAGGGVRLYVTRVAGSGTYA